MNAQNETPRRQSIVVGVVLHQPDAVLHQAARLALDLGAELICVFVDAGRYTVEENADGSVVSLPFDPDLPELGEEASDPELLRRIERVLAAQPVVWSFRAVAGEPARALAHLADTLDARLIVVGSRAPGIIAGVEEFFTGSVAVHLAHRQHRPVVVVPVAPTTPDQKAPWE